MMTPCSKRCQLRVKAVFRYGTVPPPKTLQITKQLVACYPLLFAPFRLTQYPMALSRFPVLKAGAGRYLSSTVCNNKKTTHDLCLNLRCRSTVLPQFINLSLSDILYCTLNLLVTRDKNMQCMIEHIPLCPREYYAEQWLWQAQSHTRQP